ncbi:MAG TPA: biotin/lipoyl-containing protein [Candidatus Limnocylindria bacterium]|nr:biotin/lipoyl-containing protein [Candidatus Limnocylindria bacterium]
MSDTDHVLGLLDDLMRLADGSPAVTIEVEADSFAVSVTRRGGARPDASLATTERPAVTTRDAVPTRPPTQRVHATTVGVFSPEREWKRGDAVKRGDVLGGIKSLGQVAKIVAPADGEVHEVLVAGGAPVEYGQPLLVITLR